MSYLAQSNHRNAAAQSGNRHGRVSIGGGAVAKLQKQNETPSARERAPPAPGSSPLKSKTRSITWPLPLYPQHETPPLLDTAQECSCKPRVTCPFPLPRTFPTFRLSLTHPSHFTTTQHVKQKPNADLSQASIKHTQESQSCLTEPKATMATPLLNPVTGTGVYLSVVVPSPSCKSKTKRRQPENTPPPHQAAVPSNQRQEASPRRSGCIPSTRPRRCWSPHRNEPAYHASSAHYPSLAPSQQPASPLPNPPTSQQHNTSNRTLTSVSHKQASNTPKNHNHVLPRPKQPSQRRCSIR
jgi:hypothetical protein